MRFADANVPSGSCLSAENMVVALAELPSRFDSLVILTSFPDASSGVDGSQDKSIRINKIPD